jgi:hypothetical protein
MVVKLLKMWSNDPGHNIYIICYDVMFIFGNLRIQRHVLELDVVRRGLVLLNVDTLHKILTSLYYD